MAELIGIRFSPWTEKARWALDHHRLAYRYSEHLVLFGMPALRLKMRMFRESPTVPAFIDGRIRIADSYQIARHADRIGISAKLFPSAHEAEIAECNSISEHGLDAGRALMIQKLRTNREAQLESLPSFLRAKVFLPLVPVGLAYIAHEFHAERHTQDEHRQELRAALTRARKALARGGGNHVTGSFSFADIALAALIQFVRPVEHEALPLAPAVRTCWEDQSLVGEFGDLVTWRDGLYRNLRGT